MSRPRAATSDASNRPVGLEANLYRAIHRVNISTDSQYERIVKNYTHKKTAAWYDTYTVRNMYKDT